MRPPLVVSRDSPLLEELIRLTAAAGVTPHVEPPGIAALQGWVLAPLVLVGLDAAAELQSLGPPRRPDVHVVTATPPEHGDTDTTYRTALALGAERVLSLPVDAEWLTQRLIDAGDDGLAPGRLVGVLGGSGGAGATTFACALAQVASRSGTALVVDTDPLGPGVDRVLGLDATEGVRWPDLETTTGRLGARALREALPGRDRLSALSWPAGRSAPLEPGVLRECLSAARRGHDLVAVDLPRSADPMVAEVASRCDLVVLVVAPTVCGAASTTSTVARFEQRGQWGVVVRGRGLDPDDVARVTGLPLLAEMADQRRVVESVDLGLGPVRSRGGPLARAASRVLAAVRP
ncbi:septum site-determining protein Ssd [Nocardioides dilutus]